MPIPRVPRCRVAAWTLFFLGLASCAFAQTSTAPPLVRPDGDHPLRIAVTTWAAAAAADWATTYGFCNGYRDLMHEENPLLQHLDRHPVLLVAEGAAIDGLSGWVMHHALRRHQRIARFVFYGAAAYRGYLAIHNVRMMQRADEIRASSPASVIVP